MHEWIKKLDPAIPKFWLVALAGVSWSIIGVVLCEMAYHWLVDSHSSFKMYLSIVGIILAVVFYYFMFSKIAVKNIKRLDLVKDKSCLFAFQAWKGYLIILFMVPLGYFLRHSQFPKQYLAAIYLTIGGALFISSFHYYKYIWKSRVD